MIRRHSLFQMDVTEQVPRLYVYPSHCQFLTVSSSQFYQLEKLGDFFSSLLG